MCVLRGRAAWTFHRAISEGDCDGFGGRGQDRSKTEGQKDARPGTGPGNGEVKSEQAAF